MTSLKSRALEEIAAAWQEARGRAGHVCNYNEVSCEYR